MPKDNSKILWTARKVTLNDPFNVSTSNGLGEVDQALCDSDGDRCNRRVSGNSKLVVRKEVSDVQGMTSGSPGGERYFASILAGDGQPLVITHALTAENHGDTDRAPW